MHKFAVTILFVFACALSSMAQSTDTHDWTGFYVGGNGFVSRDAATAGDADYSINQISNLFVTGRGLVVVPGTIRPLSSSGNHTGGGGGAQAGYLWQSGSIVFGVEGTFDPFSRTLSVLDGEILPSTVLAPPSPVTAQRDYRISQELSIRGRVGYAFGNTLVYGTGGYANASVRVNTTGSYTNPGGVSPTVCGAPGNPCFNSGPEGPVITTATGQQRKGGWTLGGGIEHALGDRFSIGGEYRHTNIRLNNFVMGPTTTVNTGPETRGDNGQTGLLGMVSTIPITNTSIRSNAVRFRFNFHF